MFPSTPLIDIGAVAGGERVGSANTILATTTFENGLKAGRFAKLDTGSVDNFDGSVTPVPAGIVLRTPSSAVEDDGTYNTDYTTVIDFMRQGLATVDVKSGDTPAMFGRVYVSNQGDANDGLATTTNTEVAVNAEFIQEVKTGVWLVYLNATPGDIATHIADALAAHAASAISVLDAAGLTTAINVETALAEILVRTNALIADPGDAGAIPVVRSGNCALTSAGAGETRTLAIPGAAGIVRDLSFDVDGGGDITITAASAINQTGNNTMVFSDAGEHIQLVAVQVAGALVWRVGANDGVILSTV